MKISASTKRILARQGGKRKALNGQATKKIRLYDKQRGSCAYCSNIFPIQRLTFDHIIRKREGGGNRIDNLVLACPPCNIRRELPESPREIVLKRWADWHREYVVNYAL